MVEIARNIPDANDRLVRYFIDKGMRERLSFGIFKDFAMSRLANVLIGFKCRDPHVDSERTASLALIFISASMLAIRT